MASAEALLDAADAASTKPADTPVEAKPSAEALLDAADAGAEKPKVSVEPMGRMARLGTGLMDPLMGAGQLGLHVAQGAAHLVPGSHEGIDRVVAEEDKNIAAREKKIEAESPQGVNWWRLAGNIANPINYFMPSRLFGAANIGTKALSGAAQGGAVAALEPATHGNFAGEKLLQAGMGATVGAVVAPIGQWLTAAKGEDALKDKAVRTILDRIQKDEKGGGPTAQDMLDLLATAPGKPLITPDVGGENLMGLLGRVARSPGEARQIIRQHLADRDMDAGLRLAEDVNQGVGQGSAHDTAQALAAARSKSAAPKYEAAFSRIVTSPKEAAAVERFIHDPIGQDALQRGLRVIQLENLAADAPFNPAAYGVTKGADGKYVLGADVPNLRLMDAVKRGYDEIVEDFRDKVTGRLNLNQYGRAVNLVRATYVQQLRDMYPRYASALDAWGGPSRSIDALQAGRDFLKREPEAVAKRLSELSPNDREFYKMGAAATLRKIIGQTGPQGDEARRIVGNSYTRAQLRPLFDSDTAYDRFIDAVKAESRMFNTGVRALGGSQTAERVAEDTAGLDIPTVAHAARGGLHAVGGHPVGAMYDLGRVIERLRPKGDPKLNAEVARLLISPPNDLMAAFNRLPLASPSLPARAVGAAVPGAAVSAADLER